MVKKSNPLECVIKLPTIWTDGKAEWEESEKEKKSEERKMRRRAAKHISKSKCTKHHMFGPLLEVG